MSSRLAAYINNFREDFTVMVTLTYPEVWPRDGRAVKAHLRAFNERLRRTGWLKKNSLVWFLEFQKRGAPHFHFLATAFISRHFVAKAWSEITKGNIAACSRVEQIRNPNSAGAYARKYAIKSEQKAVPPGFEHVGRMWGCIGPKTGEHGDSRLPSVAAATKGLDFKGLFSPVFSVQREFRGKVVKTLSGWVFYGSESEVNRLWHWLRAKGLFDGQTEVNRGCSTRRLLDAQRAPPESTARAVRPSWMPSHGALTQTKSATANEFASFWD